MSSPQPVPRKGLGCSWPDTWPYGPKISERMASRKGLRNLISLHQGWLSGREWRQTECARMMSSATVPAISRSEPRIGPGRVATVSFF